MYIIYVYMYIPLDINLLPLADICPRYRQQTWLDMHMSYSKFQDTLRMQFFRALKLFLTLQALFTHNYTETGALL